VLAWARGIYVLTCVNVGANLPVGALPASKGCPMTALHRCPHTGHGRARFTRVPLRRWAAVALAATLVPVLFAGDRALAAIHVDNPYVGATKYLNPHWAANVEATAQSTSDATLAAKMRTVKTYPTAVWMDRIAAVTGSDGSPGLAGYLGEALAQVQGTTPEVVEIVIYDLPGRDCAALASNGELPATDAGLSTYKSSYIDPIAAILSDPKYAALRLVTIIEPDSLPNIVTNLSIQACSTAAPYYEAGVEYALNKLHAIANVYTYLDMAHSGWLGWPNNAGGAVNEFAKVANATTAGKASIDGFISNTSNYTPVKEPYLAPPSR
jgi:cellulose 1,4-beta-cellobiosidase